MSVNSSSEASSLSDFEIIDWPVREENEYIPEPPIREDRIVPLEVTPSPFRPTPRDPRIRRTPNPEPVRYPYFRNAPRDVTPYDNPEIIDIDSRPGNADFMRHLSSTGRDRFYRPPPQPMLPRISVNLALAEPRPIQDYYTPPPRAPRNPVPPTFVNNSVQTDPTEGEAEPRKNQ